MGMQITDVRVRRIEKEGKMKAIVSITLDNEFVVHDIKVIEGEKGLFIANTICVLIIFRYFTKMKSKNNATYHYLYVILRFE